MTGLTGLTGLEDAEGSVVGMNVVNKSDVHKRIHFAVMAIESGAKKLGIPGQLMHDRLKAQDLIHNRLIAMYDYLHTQSIDWVAEDTVTTLKNWEAGI